MRNIMYYTGNYFPDIWLIGQLSMKKNVFISYTRQNLGEQTAQHIEQQLSAAGYDVFLDKKRLKAGDTWADKIYNTIRATDAMIVLLELATAESDWVQREVDVARGLHITIIPIVIAPDTDVIMALERLALEHIQAEFYDDSATWFSNFQIILDDCIKKTRDNQRLIIDLIEKKNVSSKARDKKRYASFQLSAGEHLCKIYLATGNMLSFRGIDVIVNSENDYMQMARAYESDTVSGDLRYLGSLRQSGNRIIEDTMQIELDQQVEAYGGRPIGLGQVLVTHSGHTRSELREETRARFIFHVSAVRVSREAQKKLQPIENKDGIKTAVRRCLDLVVALNENLGIFSPENTQTYEAECEIAEAGKYKPISSIIFPLFGTGTGGRSARAVIPAMLDGIESFLLNRDDEQMVREIYLCAYSVDDVQVAQELMSRRFEEVKK